MLLQIGYLELAATFVVGAAALMMFIGRSRYYRPMLAIVGCMCLAAIVTPADLFSMLLMTIAFLAVYFVGTRRATANVARRSASQVSECGSTLRVASADRKRKRARSESLH
jgi:Sec-independent protein secretion pathway component TatC